jgi:hypothetical protein
MKDARHIGDVGLVPQIKKTEPYQLPQPKKLSIERVSRSVQGLMERLSNQKRITRREALIGGGLITASAAGGIAGAVITNNEGQKISTTDHASNLEHRNLAKIEGRKLSLSEMIRIVESQSGGNTDPLMERIHRFNDANPNHQTTTLDADSSGFYHETDRPVIGIYKIAQTPLRVRSTPRDDSDANILREVAHTDEVHDISTDGFILGSDVFGSPYENSPLGNITLRDEKNRPQFGGVWVLELNAREIDGQLTFSPEDRLTPESQKNQATLPAIAALSLKALTPQEARAELTNQL